MPRLLSSAPTERRSNKVLSRAAEFNHRLPASRATVTCTEHANPADNSTDRNAAWQAADNTPGGMCSRRATANIATFATFATFAAFAAFATGHTARMRKETKNAATATCVLPGTSPSLPLHAADDIMPRGVKPTTYRVACSSQLACMPRFLPAGMHATLPSRASQDMPADAQH